MKEFFNHFIPREKSVRVWWGIIIILVFFLGWILGGRNHDKPSSITQYTLTGSDEISLWTCSMHPQIRQPKPGKCPICGMDLIPVKKSERSENPRQIFLSESARRMAEIEVAPVEKKYVVNEIHLVGKIEYDETRLKYITARVAGRIDRLYVNFTGTPVRPGDHLVELYSPELLSTQQELVQTLNILNTFSSETAPEIKEPFERQFHSARERLRLWGLTEEQIEKLEKERQLTDHITIYSPIGGIVIEKNALEGSYVETGARIYSIADLSRVWVKLDAYESDLPWLRYGQEVECETESYPGEVFKGRLAFIDPVIDKQTRTAKVRLNLANPGLKLKPEMFVRALVKSKIASGGQVMDPSLNGKWICPMHPEVIKDDTGRCDVCDMPLVRAEELGYVSTTQLKTGPPLVIPASAPLITGKRAIVYVEIPDSPGNYEGREIELGPRAGNYYIVQSGLREGEKVVVKGNFKIDSAIQIQAGKSMMNPTGGMSISHQHGEQSISPSRIDTSKKKDTRQTEIPVQFLQQIDEIFSHYFAIQQALSHDRLEQALHSSADLQKSLQQMDMKALPAGIHRDWMPIYSEIKKASQNLANSQNISVARHHFNTLSRAVLEMARLYGSSAHRLFVYHCPMAFDSKGADWLQNKEGTENPYFGSAMFTCGNLTADLSSTMKGKTNSAGHHHEQ